MFKTTFRIISLFILIIFLSSWGSVGHGIISSKCAASFPASMVGFQIWSDSLKSNASNADNRKSQDPNESPKHFIDIDSYSEFLSTGRIVSTYDSIVALHGSSTVINYGTLPWATVNMYDTLVVDFKKLRWHKAMLDASDLGHYVADGHMPLHITKNYDGQLSGQSGIHSRYETSMVGTYQTALGNYTGSPNSNYVTNINKYIFNYIYTNYRYKDSVLLADTYAKNLAGGSTSSTAYYTALWNKTQFTNTLFKNASHSIAELIYSAWVDAGSPPFLAKTFPSAVNSILDNNISVYPNPSSGSINVVGDDVSRIEVCSITGAKLGVFYNKVIDINNLSNGMYILSIYGKEGLLKKEKVLLTR